MLSAPRQRRHGKVSRALDWSADHVGDLLFGAFAAIVVAAVLLVLVLLAARAF